MNQLVWIAGRWGIGMAWLVMAPVAFGQTPQIKIPDLSPSVQDRFEHADTDHNGALDRMEAANAGYAVDENFDAIDTNHDHVITLYEISTYLAERTRAWANADTNGDGVVSREEAAKVPSLAKIFSKADRDGDGVVRKQEEETFSETTLYRDVDLPYVVPNIINKKF
ncbi:MAG: EF-hand domain-containing protein [Mycobacteriales bacterium]